MANLEISEKEIALALLGGFTPTEEEIQDIFECDELDPTPANRVRATARILAIKVRHLHKELTTGNLF